MLVRLLVRLLRRLNINEYFKLQIYPKGKVQDAVPLNANQPISGKGGAQYRKHAGFALETQKYPDSVNHVSVQFSLKF